MKIKVLIVDDEKLARDLIRSLVCEREDIDIVGEASNGRMAVEMVNKLKPDLMFLDIQMPGVSGIEMISKIDPMILPYIIFVTAYDQYAIKAFELHALDYLLKPFEKERFFDSVDRAKAAIANQDLNRLTRKILQLTQGYSRQASADAGDKNKDKPTYLERITFREGQRILAVKTVDIAWLEAANQYVRIHTLKKSHIISQSLNHLQQQLDPRVFYRIHRSAIVNSRFIKEIHTAKNGIHTIHLSGGHTLNLSRSNRMLLPELLKHCR
jgi:two-component system LytT family response regulator